MIIKNEFHKDSHIQNQWRVRSNQYQSWFIFITFRVFDLFWVLYISNRKYINFVH